MVSTYLNGSNNEYICNGTILTVLKCTTATLSSWCKVFSFRENVQMDDVSLSSAGRLLQMTSAYTVPTVSWCRPSADDLGYCRDQDAVICQVRQGGADVSRVENGGSGQKIG